MSSTDTQVIRPSGSAKLRLPHTFQTLSRYRRLLSRYLRPEWLRMGLLAVVLLCSMGVQVTAPLLASRFIDRAVDGAALRSLILLALATMAVALVGQVAGVVEAWVAENVSWAATNALRADLVAHVLRLDAGFHAEHTAGELIERVDGDVTILARFFSRFVVYVAGNAILIVVVLGLLFGVDWRVGLGVSGFVLVGLIVMLRIRAAATPAWAAERQASANFYGSLSEYLAGAEDVRSSAAGPFVLRRFVEVMRAWLRVWLRAGMWGYAIAATSQGIFALGTAAALGLAAMQYRAGALTIGLVYLIFQYTDVLRRPTEQIRNELQDLQQADASIGRVEALLAVAPRLVDDGIAGLPPGPLSVDLDAVTFGYGVGTPVLVGVSLCVEAGRVLGVVGRTGSGKTTLARLIPRFHDPDDGIVRLGGVDIRTVPLADVRTRIGVVSQEVQLFNASVRDNLTLFDDAVPDERLTVVLGALGLGGWLRALPVGLDTRLGPGGAGLSAGQAQLLACGRLFLREPDVIILDEASSRLDPASERLLHDALGRLLAGRTGIVIAHRLDTLAFADDILVLEDGRVRECGERVALARDPGSRFAELLRATSVEARV